MESMVNREKTTYCICLKDLTSEDKETIGGCSHPRAVYTGEKRKPLKGEWYLSGAIIKAYKAPNDLNSEYYIAELVNFEIGE